MSIQGLPDQPKQEISGWLLKGFRSDLYTGDVLQCFLDGDEEIGFVERAMGSHMVERKVGEKQWKVWIYGQETENNNE